MARSLDPRRLFTRNYLKSLKNPSQAHVTGVTARVHSSLHSESFEMRNSSANRDRFEWIPVHNVM